MQLWHVLGLVALCGLSVDAFSTAGICGAVQLQLRQRSLMMTGRHSRIGKAAAFGLRMSDDAEMVKEEAPAPVRRGKATFDEKTNWKMTMSLFPVPTEGIVTPAEVQVGCKLQFQEDEGFEPPQGRIVVLDKDNKYIGDSMSFWKMDEDPTKEGFDKAGFWIWGLFEEPQYPFMTFDLQIKQEIKLSEGSIPPGKIYGQAKISRDKAKGVSLTEGVLTCRKPYKIAVDLLGLSDGILQEVQACGTFTLSPE